MTLDYSHLRVLDEAVEQGSELLQDVHAFLCRFVVFPTPEAAVAATLWVAHTHALSAFESTPRLALLSPEPASGKSRTEEVLELLVPAPLHALNASVAAVFRCIESDRPTILFDEVDAIFGRHGKDDGAEDLRGLLNAGHRRGATIPRCVGRSQDVVRFPVFAAVALAGLGDLPDTVMSRSIIVRMRRRAPHERVAPFRYRDAQPEGHALRDRLADWADDHQAKLADARPTMPDGVEDRPADCWEPLLAVADAAGGDWPKRARAACLELVKVGASREASLGVRLLSDLRAIFGDRHVMSTEDLLAGLHGIDEAPWADLRGKELDPRGLARRLKEYGVNSTTIKVDGKAAKGYKREDLWDAWQRYLPAEVLRPLPAQPPRPEGTPEVTDGGEATDASVTGPASVTAPEPLTCQVAPVTQVTHLREATPVLPMTVACGHPTGICRSCHQPLDPVLGDNVHPSCEVAL